MAVATKVTRFCGAEVVGDAGVGWTTASALTCGLLVVDPASAVVAAGTVTVAKVAVNVPGLRSADDCADDGGDDGGDDVVLGVEAGWVALPVCNGIEAGAVGFRSPDSAGPRTVASGALLGVVDVVVLLDVDAPFFASELVEAVVLVEVVVVEVNVDVDVLAVEEPTDDEEPADEVADEFADDPVDADDPDPDCPDGSAHAIPEPHTTAAPIPHAAARPPIRPMYPATPIRI